MRDLPVVEEEAGQRQCGQTGESWDPMDPMKSTDGGNTWTEPMN